jgi:hypothetical protein
VPCKDSLINTPMRDFAWLCRIAQTTTVAKWLSKAANSMVSGLAWLGGKLAGGVLWAAGADKPLQPGEEAGEVPHGGCSYWIALSLVGLPGKHEAGRIV